MVVSVFESACDDIDGKSPLTTKVVVSENNRWDAISQPGRFRIEFGDCYRKEQAWILVERVGPLLAESRTALTTKPTPAPMAAPMADAAAAETIGRADAGPGAAADVGALRLADLRPHLRADLPPICDGTAAVVATDVVADHHRLREVLAHLRADDLPKHIDALPHGPRDDRGETKGQELHPLGHRVVVHLPDGRRPHHHCLLLVLAVLGIQEQEQEHRQGRGSARGSTFCADAGRSVGARLTRPPD